MYVLHTTGQFKKDYKLCIRRHYKMDLLHTIFAELEKSASLPAKYLPHKLTGNYKGFWECHIQPDWLLIWFHNTTTGQIDLVRTGTHADLF